LTSAGTTRRVLVVACNFPPDASVGTQRTLRLVRHLTTEGWDVDALTLAQEGFRPGTVTDPALLSKVPTSVTVLRALPLRPFERLSAALKRKKPAAGPAPATTAPAPAAGVGVKPAPPGTLSTVRRAVTAMLALPDREVSWVVPAVWKAWRHARQARPDVIYSSGPPFSAHIVALLLSRLLGVRWVADFRDPWARAPWREDRFEFERRAWAVFERLVVMRADRVVFVTATNRDDFGAAYGPEVARRFALISNGCDATEFEGLQRRQDGPFVLLHAGSLYGARNPAGLLRSVAAAIAKGELDPATFRLRFLGRIGIPGLNLPAIASELGLGDVVEFVNHVPRRDSLQQMVDASALLVVQPVTTVSIPAKLYEYMASGRPILALAQPGGETAELVERAHGGVSVLADDEAAVTRGVIDVVRLARGGFTPVDRRFYDGAIRAAELQALLDAVAAGAAR
jgi:glycosyltransferase involved in cell wall biosynthesis